MRELTIITLTIVLTGCSGDGLHALLERCRLADPAPPAKMSAVVLCDPTPFSTCNEQTLRSTLQSSAHTLALRQGRVVLYTLDAVRAVREVSRYDTPIPTGTSDAARAAYAARVEREALVTLGKPTGDVFASPPRCSRIAAALTNIAQEHHPVGYEPVTIILSDLRDTDLVGDCRPAPTWDSFRTTLARTRLLERGSFPSRVIIAFYHLSQPAEGCSANEYRAATVRDLFRHALEQAGASVTVTGGAPEL